MRFRGDATSAEPGPSSAGDAIRLVDVELARPLEPLGALRPALGGDYGRLRILVRLHGRPLGTVNMPLPAGGLDAQPMADAIWAELAEVIREHCRHDRLAVPDQLTVAGLAQSGEAPCSWRLAIDEATAPLATLVITTCGGADSRLTETVRGALAQTYPRFEVVVVDNRPATSGVQEILDTAFGAMPNLSYVAEARPGLSHARNRGAAAARGEIVAFTDDDVELDPDWLGYLVAGFDGPAIACVTGLILPLELETGAQRLLEEFGGYTKGFVRRIWDCAEHRPDDPLYPYTVGTFGSGANAAFRVTALADLGGFDGALGTGTPARGGEDIDLYVTCVRRGYQIAYEPAAVVRHAHLREMAQVRQKVRNYGVGLGAMLTKQLFMSRSSAAALLRRIPAGVVHLLSKGSPKNAARSVSYPPSLVLAEIEGLLYGPVAYLRSRIAS